MPSFNGVLLRTPLLTAILYLIAFTGTTSAQQTSRRQTTDRADEVIRINTDLVQTEVTVFDRQGRFVEGLRPEQFELTLNGTKQSVSFFERVMAGSSSEAAQLAAARGNAATENKPNKPERPASTDRGRVLFFFLDDVHLSAASVVRARETLQWFVDNKMNPNDQVAIVSTSGQIGFLQQLTDNPSVLHAAIARLNYKMNSEAYTGKTQISEYMATQVMDYGNRELYAYLLESIKIEQQTGPGSRHGDHRLAASYSSAPYLRNRLQQINAQGRMTTEDTLGALRSLILSSSVLPGRKLVFFLSDGFIINERKAGALEALQRVTQAAVRSGVVVYTMDLRGTFFNLGSAVDASTNEYIDLSGRRAGLAFGEITATQEALQLIADETGGRAVFNSSSIGDGILQAIRETSDYYLLAWRPDSREQREGKLRLQVTVKDRPDLRVRLRSNFYSPSPGLLTKTDKSEEAKEKTTTSNTVDAQLVAALGSLYPDRRLPVSLSLGYLNTNEAGLVLKVSMQLDRQALDINPDEKPQKVELDVIGAAVDDRGQFSSFKQLLTVAADTSQETQRAVTWNQQLRLKPGLYQVRVAVRERSSGRTGAAMQWIEIPDISSGGFGLSSLFLGERKEEVREGTQAAAGPRSIIVDVDHRFARTSILRFQTYVYDATSGQNGPEVWIQTQVFRNRRQVMSIAPGKVPLTTDAARLPYWSEIPLDSLPPGQYVLLVSATDRIRNRSTAQQIKFSVE